VSTRRRSIAELRELLGDEAAGLTDEQMHALRETAYRHAAAIVDAMRQHLRVNQAVASGESAASPVRFGRSSSLGEHHSGGLAADGSLTRLRKGKGRAA